MKNRKQKTKADDDNLILIQKINDSVILAESQKRKITQMLPSITKRGKKRLKDFLEKEKKQLGNIENEIQATYEDTLIAIKGSEQQGKKVIRETLEEKEKNKEENPEALLATLHKI